MDSGFTQTLFQPNRCITFDGSDKRHLYNINAWKQHKPSVKRSPGTRAKTLGTLTKVDMCLSLSLNCLWIQGRRNKKKLNQSLDGLAPLVKYPPRDNFNPLQNPDICQTPTLLCYIICTNYTMKNIDNYLPTLGMLRMWKIIKI